MSRCGARERTSFKGATDARTFAALDFIPEDVVTDAKVVAPPADDA
jgi:hypothetical protein